uniref:Uncharacterized protein n=1 Tax=Peronospora matthiolae TaxID=2874970 RepID=A0AAV1TKG4_9STRA
MGLASVVREEELRMYHANGIMTSAPIRTQQECECREWVIYANRISLFPYARLTSDKHTGWTSDGTLHGRFDSQRLIRGGRAN